MTASSLRTARAATLSAGIGAGSLDTVLATAIARTAPAAAVAATTKTWRGGWTGELGATIANIIGKGLPVIPEEFGCAGDGTTDDTTKLQALLDAIGAATTAYTAGSPALYANEHKLPTLKLSPGRAYATTDELQLPVAVNIDGQGAALIPTLGSSSGKYALSTVTHNTFRAEISDLTILRAENGIRVNNSNANTGHILLKGVRFGYVAQIAVWLENAQSSTVKMLDCHWLFARQAVLIAKCDLCFIQGGWVKAQVFDTDEQVLFDNTGRLYMRDICLIPIAHTGTPVNCGWIANRYSSSLVAGGGRSGVVDCDGVRFGGESGSVSPVNNYADAQTNAVSLRTRVTLRNCDAVSADGTRAAGSGTRRCITRLFSVPNIIEMRNLQGGIGALALDYATSTPPTLLTDDILVDVVGEPIMDTNSFASVTDYIPQELFKYAQPGRRRTHDYSSGKTLELSHMRGCVITNNSAAANATLTHALPAGYKGMRVTVTNVKAASDTGYIQVQTQAGETMQRGVNSGTLYYVRLVGTVSNDFECVETGVWRRVGPDPWSALGISADQGDAALTYDPRLGYQTLLFNTALTQARAVTLSTSGAVLGQRIRTVRGNSATGGFNLTVVSKALASFGTWVEHEFNGVSSWTEIASGSL